MKTTTKRDYTRNLVLTAMFAALIAVGAFIKIPVPVAPFTLQVFFVNLAGLMLGGVWGTASAAIYVTLGLIGLPIFTHGGGIGYVLNPTFGYLLGFIVGAGVTGIVSRKNGRLSVKRMILASVLDMLIIYLMGATYCYCISNFYLGKDVAIGAAVVSYILVFIPGDGLSCAISIVIAKKLVKALKMEKIDPTIREQSEEEILEEGDGAI